MAELKPEKRNRSKKDFMLYCRSKQLTLPILTTKTKLSQTKRNNRWINYGIFTRDTSHFSFHTVSLTITPKACTIIQYRPTGPLHLKFYSLVYWYESLCSWHDFLTSCILNAFYKCSSYSNNIILNRSIIKSNSNKNQNTLYMRILLIRLQNDWNLQLFNNHDFVIRIT